jgi:hypothetical protein
MFEIGTTRFARPARRPGYQGAQAPPALARRSTACRSTHQHQPYRRQLRQAHERADKPPCAAASSTSSCRHPRGQPRGRRHLQLVCRCRSPQTSFNRVMWGRRKLAKRFIRPPDARIRACRDPAGDRSDPCPGSIRKRAVVPRSVLESVQYSASTGLSRDRCSHERWGVRSGSRDRAIGAALGRSERRVEARQ